MAQSGSSGGDLPAALVTGASSGIGRATAIALVRRGFRLILVARREDRLRTLADQFNGTAPATVIPLDLSDADATKAGVATVLERHGPVQVLVNNAGFGIYRPFLDLDDEAVRDFMQVHYFSAVELIRALLPGMLERGSGHVINVASIATKVGPWGHSGYAASKSALAALTQSLACEYADRGVHFSCVNPGIVQSAFFDAPSYKGMCPTVQRRGISSDVVARRIVSLLDRPRIELCIPAHYRAIDWVRALSPAWAQRIVARSSRPGNADEP
jgi:short-subunit dehydrogenase